MQTDRRLQTNVRRASSLNAAYHRVGGIIMYCRLKCSILLYRYFPSLTLAARSRAHLLQTCRPDIPSHPRHRTYMSAVVFHSSCRHDVKTTAAILSLSATGSAVRSSHYCRQAGISSFWNVWNNLPPHVTSAPSLANFRQRLKTLQNHTRTKSYPDIHIWLIFDFPTWTLQNQHYLGHVNNFDDDDDDEPRNYNSWTSCEWRRGACSMYVCMYVCMYVWCFVYLL